MTIIERLFNKGKITEEILDVTLHACMDGKIVNLTEVEDTSFSQGVWGEGFAIEAKTGTIVSPVQGTVSEVDEILGTVSISTKQNVDVLVHAGIQMSRYSKVIQAALEEMESAMNQEIHILEVFAEEGQQVDVGDVIMKLNLDFMKDNNIRVVVPTVVAHSGDFAMQMIEENKVLEKEKGLTTSGKPIAKMKKIG